MQIANYGLEVNREAAIPGPHVIQTEQIWHSGPVIGRTKQTVHLLGMSRMDDAADVVDTG